MIKGTLTHTENCKPTSRRLLDGIMVFLKTINHLNLQITAIYVTFVLSLAPYKDA